MLVVLPIQTDPGAVQALHPMASQQKAMWAKVEKDTKRGKRRWKMAELFADERCSEAILEFVRTTDVGRKSRWRRRRRRALSWGRNRSALGASASAGSAG